MAQVTSREEILLEYRIAVLEGIVDWMLNNGVFVKAIEPEDMAAVHKKALELTRRRYPGAAIDFSGRWER